MKRNGMILGMIVWIGIAMMAASCSSKAHSQTKDDSTKDAQAKVEAAPINVKVAPVALSSLTETLEGMGTTLADKDIRFSAETAGRLEYLAADLGDHVKKGQVLARIDYQMLKAQKNQAQAAYDLAKKTYDRLSKLREEALISQQQVDEAKNNLDQADAALNIASVSLNHTVVRSTISGVVTNKLVEQGEYVTPGAPLLQVMDYSTIVVSASIPEKEAARISKGTPVKVRIDALNEAFEGTVRVLVPSANAASKTYELRLNIPNKDHKILVGMAANYSIDMNTYNDVVVAKQDVVIEEENNRRAVFVNDDGKARRVDVTLGAIAGDLVVVNGVDVGAQLVVSGQRDLVDGQPIHIVVD